MQKEEPGYEATVFPKFDNKPLMTVGYHPYATIVSEPDPRKIGKEGLVNGAGWKCTLRNVRNFIICLILQSQ